MSSTTRPMPTAMPTAMATPSATGHRTVHRACTICEATCGIAVHLDAHDRVLRIEGDDADPFSRGHVCPKVVAMGGLQDDPDRLRQPLVREGDRWLPASWPAALDAAAEGLLRVKAAHGAQALALYRGNPGIHDAGTLLSTGVLVQALGTRQVFSAGSLDTWPRFVQCTEVYGSPIRIPIPDIDRTQHLLVLGANPVVSQGSVLTAPGIADRLRALRARGGKLVVIDPRRTETADLADEHHAIRPGGDAALLLAMVQVLVAEGRTRLGAAEGLVDGWDALVAAVAPFTPEAVAPACGIDPATIARLAREFAAAPAAAAYGRMGTSVQAFGALACWAIDLLAIVSGQLDAPGGLMWPKPAAPLNFAFEAAGLPVALGRWRSRARGREERFGDLPITALAEEIETPGDGQVRALVTVAGNPAHTAPNAPRLDRALAGLDFMVSLDGYLNETTRHARVILPPAGPLQREHYDLLLNHVAVRHVAKWSPAVWPPGAAPDGTSDDSPDGWHTALALARRLAGPGAPPDGAFEQAVTQRLLQGALAASPFAPQVDIATVMAAVGDAPGVARVVDGLLRLGPYGDGCGAAPGGLTLERVRAAPHGLDLGAMVPQLPGILATASGRIALLPPRFRDDLVRLQGWLRDETDRLTASPAAAGRSTADAASTAQGQPLTLINRRDARSMNSWLHNLPALAKGPARCALEMHPRDAQARGLGEGDTVRLRSRVGALTLPLHLSARLMPGVVAVPHGFGHAVAGTGQAVAAARPGDNVNAVCDDERFDEASGAIALFGVPVWVERDAQGRA